MRILIHGLTALSLGLIVAANAVAGSPSRFRVAVLSSAGAAGNSIDDFGVVAGSYRLANNAIHASVWAFGRQVDLGTLGTAPGLSSLVQWPVKNFQGIVSGISLTDRIDPNKETWSCGFFMPNPNSNICLGFVWNPLTQKMRALPTLGGNNAFATGTNDFSETVGWAENTVHDATCVAPQVLQFKPVVWGPGRDDIRALPLIGNDTAGAATAINDQGQIVGISGTCGIAVGGVSAAHAVLWQNGVAMELVNPNGAPYWNTPMMINQRGDVVGFAGVPNDPQGILTPPFLWTRANGWTFLPMLPGEIAGVATSINERRQIVGYSNDANNDFHPWLLQDGKLYNLNDLVLPGSGLTGPLLIAFDINDRGEITGTSATGQAFIAIPVSSEP